MAVIELSEELLEQERTHEHPSIQDVADVKSQLMRSGDVPLYGEVRLNNGEHWNRLQKLAEYTCMRLDIQEAWERGRVIDKVAVIPKIAELAISGQLKGVFS
jgi:hypothetical protein